MERHGFGGLVGDRAWTDLIAAAGEHRYRRGEAVLRQGDAGGTVHLLVAGRVRVSAVRRDGEEVPLAFRGRGELIGEAALFRGEPTRAASVTAVSETVSAVFRAAQFKQVTEAMGIGALVAESIVHRQRESDALRILQARRTSERWLSEVLLYLAGTVGEKEGRGFPGGGPLYRVPLPQSDVATFAGMSRGSVAAGYLRLRNQNLIRTEYRAVLVDSARLRAAAEDL